MRPRLRVQVEEFPPFTTLLQSPAAISEGVRDMVTAQGGLLWLGLRLGLRSGLLEC